jgi:hypothetical protein
MSSQDANPNTIVNRCRNFKGFYPSFAPVMYSLSNNTSSYRVYSFVNINGTNFLPPSYGTTYVNFGLFTNLPITFYSSYNISFAVPLNAIQGNHNVTVVNVYNSNFSPASTQSSVGNLNYSNSITYTIT